MGIVLRARTYGDLWSCVDTVFPAMLTNGVLLAINLLVAIAYSEYLPASHWLTPSVGSSTRRRHHKFHPVVSHWLIPDDDAHSSRKPLLRFESSGDADRRPDASASEL